MLDRCCITCRGRGRIIHPGWAAWKARNEGDPPPDHELQTRRKIVQCYDCDGRGREPTEFGRFVLSSPAVVQRFSREWREVVP